MRVPNLFHALERRTLLSAVIEDGILRVIGTNAGDLIEIDVVGEASTVLINQQTEATFNIDDFAGLTIDAAAGDDDVTVDLAFSKPATLIGGNGDDHLRGGGGDDTLTGGFGDDTLDGGGTWDEPAGRTTIDYSDRTDDLTISNSEIAAAGGELDGIVGRFQTLLSGSGDDSISAAYSGIDAFAWSYVDAGGGNDTIDFMGVGSDVTVHGGAGNDDILVTASSHTATHFGDAGDDLFRVFRSSFTERIFHGGSGTDTIDWAGFINEFWPVSVTLDGVANDGSFTEYKSYDRPDNVFADVERILGTPGPDTMIGTSGDEMFVGRGGDDRLDGGGGDDTLDGGPGNDTLLGEEGDDALISLNGQGTDSIDGGTGNNRIITTASTMTPTPGSLPRGEVAAVIFTKGQLRVSGSTKPDKILVRPNSADSSQIQVLLGGWVLGSSPLASIDLIQVSAGTGNDRIQLDSSITVPAKLYGDAGNDTIFGAARADRISGGAGNDWINSGAGNDTVYGEAGEDRIFGGEGKDYLNGGEGVNLIRGEAGKDRIVANRLLDDLRNNQGDLLLNGSL